MSFLNTPRAPRRTESKPEARRDPAAAFTLIEMLVVVSIGVLMTALMVPAFSSVRGNADFTRAVYDIAGTYEQARSYAMANNTYTLAGVIEVDAGTGATGGTGKIVTAFVASKTGSRPYDINNLSNWATVYGTGTVTTNGGGFLSVTKLLNDQNLHLTDLQNGASAVPTSGNMYRPSVTAAYNLANTSGTSSTTFSWPLGSALTPTASTPPYLFSKIVEFDPQGSARVINSSNLDAVPQFIEIGLEASHGNAAMSPPANQNMGQQAAIQIDGMSGSVRIYRP